jgi:CheY-like chemotaxis protein
MVVDDAAFMRLRACKVLQDNGHDVIQAENGAEAVKQYAEAPPGVHQPVGSARLEIHKLTRRRVAMHAWASRCWKRRRSLRLHRVLGARSPAATP